MGHKTIEPRAGLARIALAIGDETRAVALVDAVLASLEAHPHASPILSPRSDDFGIRIWGGADEPFRVLLTCWRVLHSAGDARAAGLLAQARALLDAYASHIADAPLRQSFLTLVAVHRDILDQ